MYLPPRLYSLCPTLVFRRHYERLQAAQPFTLRPPTTRQPCSPSYNVLLCCRRPAHRREQFRPFTPSRSLVSADRTIHLYFYNSSKQMMMSRDGRLLQHGASSSSCRLKHTYCPSTTASRPPSREQPTALLSDALLHVRGRPGAHATDCM